MSDFPNRPLTCSILIPTWQRPDSLKKCLTGIAEINSPGVLIKETIVIRREQDWRAAEIIAGSSELRIRELVVQDAGQVAALEAGAQAATGEIIVFLDDDAVPKKDWLTHLLSHYTSEEVGAVGGKDEMLHREAPALLKTSQVGLITRWGRLIGNHASGNGQPRLVAHLKGVNMSVRRDLLAFPHGLKGKGAQTYNELAICLHVLRAGGNIIYDPSASVDHYPADRHDEDGRIEKSWRSVYDSAFNLTYVLGTLSPHPRYRRFLYGLVVGDQAVPGIIRAAIGLVEGDFSISRRLIPSLLGQFAAWFATFRNPLRMLSTKGTSKR